MIEFKIIDSFLKKKHYDELCKIKLNDIKKDEVAVYRNRIFNDGTTQLSCLSNNLIRDLFKEYTKVGTKILKHLNSKKLKLFEYSEFTIIETGKNYSFPIHNDIPAKLLSGVIYLSPEKNNGTYLYKDKKGNNKKEIEWKQNRAFFFSRSENSSWHSYEGNKNSNRRVLVYNLMTTNLKKACEIDNTSYFKTIILNKLNPLLLKHFKFIIN